MVGNSIVTLARPLPQEIGKVVEDGAIMVLCNGFLNIITVTLLRIPTQSGENQWQDRLKGIFGARCIASDFSGDLGK